MFKLIRRVLFRIAIGRYRDLSNWDFIVGERLLLTPNTTWASGEFIAKVQSGNSAQKKTERKHQGYSGF